MISSCTPRSQASEGSALMAKQIAQAHCCDYDHIRGNNELQVFVPVGSARNYINVPVYFPFDSRLDGKKITSMEMVDGSQRSTFGGTDIPSSFSTGWIVFKDECDNLLAEMPLSRLNKVLNGGKNLFFKNMPVDWGKCYMYFTSLPGTNTGFLFNVWTN